MRNRRLLDGHGQAAGSALARADEADSDGTTPRTRAQGSECTTPLWCAEFSGETAPRFAEPGAQTTPLRHPEPLAQTTPPRHAEPLPRTTPVAHAGPLTHTTPQHRAPDDDAETTPRDAVAPPERDAADAKALEPTAPIAPHGPVTAFPREVTDPLDWTSLPCAGEAFRMAAMLDDDAELAADAPVAGELIDARFRLVEEVHNGVMSSVWRAVDETTGTVVAVKLVPRELAPALDAEDLAALTRVSSHPGLVKLIAHGQRGAWWYQVATWVNGQTLESLLDTDPGRAQVADNLGPWMRQLASALDAQHRAGFVHGDVKAANVLVSDGSVHLIDLVSLRVGVPWYRHGGLTAAFASPQARSGEPADPRDDVYGLATMATRLLATASAWRSHAGTRLQQLVTRSQSAALSQALEPERDRRTASATALVYALWPAQARHALRRTVGRGVLVASVALRRRRSTSRTGHEADTKTDTKWYAAAAAAFAMLIAGIGTWQLRSFGDFGASTELASDAAAAAAKAPQVRRDSSGQRRAQAPSRQEVVPVASMQSVQSLGDVRDGSAAAVLPAIDALVEPLASQSVDLGSALGALGAIDVGGISTRSRVPEETPASLTDLVARASAASLDESDDDETTSASAQESSSEAQAEQRAGDEAGASEAQVADAEPAADAQPAADAEPAPDAQPGDVGPAAIDSRREPASPAASGASQPLLAVAEPGPVVPSVVPSLAAAVAGAHEPVAIAETRAAAAIEPALAQPLSAVASPAARQLEVSAAQPLQLLSVLDPPAQPASHGAVEALVETAAATLSATPVVGELPLVTEVTSLSERAAEPVATLVSSAVAAVPDLPLVSDALRAEGAPAQAVATVLSTVAAIPELPLALPEVPVRVAVPVEPVAAVVSAVAAIPELPVVPEVPVVEVPVEPVAAVVSAVAAIRDIPIVPEVPVVDVPVEPIAAVVSAVAAIPDIPVVPEVPVVEVPVEPVAAVVSAVAAIPDIPVVPEVPVVEVPVEPVAAVVSAVAAIPDIPVVPDVPVESIAPALPVDLPLIGRPGG